MLLPERSVTAGSVSARPSGALRLPRPSSVPARPPRQFKRESTTPAFLREIKIYFRRVTYQFSVNEYELLDKTRVLELFPASILRNENQNQVIVLRHIQSHLVIVACVCSRLQRLKRPSSHLGKLEKEYGFRRLKFSPQPDLSLPALKPFTTLPIFVQTRAECDRLLSFLTVYYCGQCLVLIVVIVVCSCFFLTLLFLSDIDGHRTTLPQIPMYVMGTEIFFPPKSAFENLPVESASDDEDNSDSSVESPEASSPSLCLSDDPPLIPDSPSEFISDAISFPVCSMNGSNADYLGDEYLNIFYPNLEQSPASPDHERFSSTSYDSLPGHEIVQHESLISASQEL